MPNINDHIASKTQEEQALCVRHTAAELLLHQGRNDATTHTFQRLTVVDVPVRRQT